MRLLVPFLISSIFLVLSCTSDKKNKVEDKSSWSMKQSTDFARQTAEEEEMAIKLYLKLREDWNMIKTETGLRYWIYKETNGIKPLPGNTVDVILEVKLLNDSLCYRTDEDMVSTFLVDKSDIETGVQEGIKLMSKGERAKFIIPSRLGHGLVGDLDKIPPLQVLVVDLHLIDIR